MAHIHQINAPMYEDRKDAALIISKKLEEFKNDDNAIIIGLPRGGVVTGYWVSKQIHVPLDVIITRKIGCPGNQEFAIGALSEDGHVMLNDRLINELEISKKELNPIMQSEFKEAKRRVDTYRNGKPLQGLKDKTILIVDDGVATGSTCEVALKCLRRMEPQKVILVTPVIPPETLVKMKKIFDDVIYLSSPDDFLSVGQFYYNFDQTEDEEVVRMLEKSRMELNQDVQAVKT